MTDTNLGKLLEVSSLHEMQGAVLASIVSTVGFALVCYFLLYTAGQMATD